MVDKNCRLFYLIFGDMQFIFIVLSFSLLTVALQLWVVILPKKNSCLICGILSGLFVSSGIVATAVWKWYMCYGVKQQGKGRRVMFLSSQFRVRSSCWPFHNVMLIISRMLWSSTHYSYFIDRKLGQKILKVELKQTQGCLTQKPIRWKAVFLWTRKNASGKSTECISFFKPF